MTGIDVRVQGLAGRITLRRPEVLNALNHPMCLELERALDAWREDEAVALVIIDAEGDRAFCAGGDITSIWYTATQGNFDFARRFWFDEYRMNLKIHRFPKPVVSLMHGIVMGGGVGIGCHGSHRIVGHTTRMAMPECAIGLIPDVGGTYLLARAPGQLGLYLGLTGTRMGPGAAIAAGFADHFVPEEHWPDLIAALAETGDPAAIAYHAAPVPEDPLLQNRDKIDQLFAAPDARAVLQALTEDPDSFSAETLATLRRNSPLSVCATAEMLRRLGPAPTMAAALAQEYRFTYRSQEQGELQEGVRAAVIDKDRQPRWRHGSVDDVTAEEVDAMLAPLGAAEWEEGK